MNVKRSLLRCLNEGYRPATSQEIRDLVYKRKIPDQFYYTSTVSIDGKIRDAESSELENIEEFYQKEGRLLFFKYGNVGLGDRNIFNGSVSRFVGIQSEI